jgi:uncharacterized protein
MPRAVERFSAFGHPEVTATHKTTFEITTEKHLSPSGNCIIAVRSEKGAADLSDQFREQMRSPGCRLITELRCREVEVTVISLSSPNLPLDHQTDLVWRRSSFTCGRTIGLYSDYTAVMLPRELITLLKLGERLDITLTAEFDPDSSREYESCGLSGLHLLNDE